MIDDETNIWPSAAPTWGYRRQQNVNPVMSMVEATVGARLHWRLPIVRGQQAVGALRGSGAFTLLGAKAFLNPRTTAVDFLAVSEWMRFGNSVRQLRNVFHVAESYEARRIEFSSPHEIFVGNAVKQFELSWRPSAVSGEQAGLLGSFYYLQGLNIQLTPEAIARLTATYVRPLLPERLRQPLPHVQPDDLVLHFRAGDVFRTNPKLVHPLYGQPPLSYYLSAVERERPSRVWLVYEDRANPCVAATESALEQRSIKTISQSGDLSSDLHVLLSARRLVAGLGSFVPAVAALSSELRKLYLFRPPIPALEAHGIKFVEAGDKAGDYRRQVLSSNWRALPEQRSLMLSYPAEALEFREHQPD